MSEDNSASVNLLADDTDIENDVLSITFVSPSTLGSYTLNGDLLVFSPAPNTFGAETLAYTIPF